ncbi:histidine phosphatase superfamily [Hypoxylon sp. FL1150]|nr:histidine phosphatase superfamily [Hypoxylon sp. FL1150]
MATIHVFRHAESMHNVDLAQRSRRDPGLSPKGLEQCQSFAQVFPLAVTHVISSPMRRAIQTALASFPGKQVMLLPQITEAGSRPSGFGSPREALVREFGNDINVDYLPRIFANLDPDSPFAYEIGKMEARFAAERQFLAGVAAAAGTGAHIAVVTHGQSCHFLTDDWSGPKAPDPRADWDGNLACRSYTVDFSTGVWHETIESLLKRGLSPIPLPGDDAGKDEVKRILADRIIERTDAVREVYHRYRLEGLP